ncbi:hypothetical protein [Algoriphagus mannitolivorans]|uniref:hypothetical protein n=1 Tax=Algoriphagus mannitolivorans TaxID=226504 RepID=UPI00041B7B34|nr:hypothetical protein [Algoriphagus mannitolivorans]
MKKSLLTYLSVFGFLGIVYGQIETEPLQFNKNGSLVWIELTNGASLGKGLLWKVAEDSIHFVEYSNFSKDIQYDEPPILKVHYSEIAYLRTVPRKAIKKNMMIGGAIGAAMGLGVGLGATENPEPKTVPVQTIGGCIFVFCIPSGTQYIVEDEPKDAVTVLLKTFAFTAVGVITGAILGNSKAVKSRIEGSREAFYALSKELESQAFWISSENVKSKNPSTQTMNP